MVKVRMQTATGSSRPGMLTTAINIAKQEGLPAFYRGTLSPLIGASFSSAFSFSALRLFKKYL